jgi:hypothetical protein
VLVVAVLKESRNAFLENLKPVAHELSEEVAGHFVFSLKNAGTNGFCGGGT